MSWWVIHSCELAPYFTWVEDQGDGRASFFDKNAIVRVAIIYDENIHLWSWCWSDIQSCFYWSQKSSFSFFTKGCPSLFKLGKPIRNSCLLLNTYCCTAFSQVFSASRCTSSESSLAPWDMVIIFPPCTLARSCCFALSNIRLQVLWSRNLMFWSL